ncbi:MAG TPA: homoserine O-acetyltransferase [Bacteroidota bacterium]|nr:homoserine O-acetyltransferase [Bacteroidota bacterium]
MTHPEGASPTLQTTRDGTIFTSREPFRLESGAILPSLDVAYTVTGRLNAGGTNAILVCHALTGNAHAADAPSSAGETIPGWFHGVIGPSLGLDTRRFCVICSNILGSCYGTTGPTSINPATGRPYRMTFPQITVRDMVRAQKMLIDSLGVRRLVTIIGGSLGGMQALEWAVMYPEIVGSIVPIATSPAHSAWCIGISETQRLAIMNDPAWQGGNYAAQPARGLTIARSIAMISYRSQGSFVRRFGRTGMAPGDGHERVRVFDDIPLSFAVESYLRYQGQKLAGRFDANAYIYLTRAMDLHDVGAGRATVPEVLGGIRARVLSIGISSDILYPPGEQKAIASAIPDAVYTEIDSPHGHDAFLIEFDAMNALLRQFLA